MDDIAPTLIFAAPISPGVEIGRQATLRWWCSKGRAGSNPVPGTNKKDKSKIDSVCPFLFANPPFPDSISAVQFTLLSVVVDLVIHQLKIKIIYYFYSFELLCD